MSFRTHNHQTTLPATVTNIADTIGPVVSGADCTYRINHDEKNHQLVVSIEGRKKDSWLNDLWLFPVIGYMDESKLKGLAFRIRNRLSKS